MLALSDCCTGLTNTDIHLALDGSLVERSEVPVVSGIGITAVGQEDCHHLSVAKGTGIVERNKPTWWREREGGGGGGGGGKEGERDVSVREGRKIK